MGTKRHYYFILNVRQTQLYDLIGTFFFFRMCCTWAVYNLMLSLFKCSLATLLCICSVFPFLHFGCFEKLYYRQWRYLPRHQSRPLPFNLLYSQELTPHSNLHYFFAYMSTYLKCGINLLIFKIRFQEGSN